MMELVGVLGSRMLFGNAQGSAYIANSGTHTLSQVPNMISAGHPSFVDIVFFNTLKNQPYAKNAFVILNVFCKFALPSLINVVTQATD